MNREKKLKNNNSEKFTVSTFIETTRSWILAFGTVFDGITVNTIKVSRNFKIIQ